MDVACAWGGQAISFAHRGAHVIASDVNDHVFVSCKSSDRDMACNYLTRKPIVRVCRLQIEVLT